MRLLKVDTLGEAREKLLQATFGKMPRKEQIPVSQALGRILAEDVTAAENIPDFRKSTVDGYAVQAADTQGVTESIPVFLDVVETIEMGKAPRRELKPGQAAYVPTGGMLPEGADAVVMVEHCETFDADSVAVYDSVSPGRNMIAVGEDIHAGKLLLTRGSRLRPQEIGVLSSAGITMLWVFQPWKITILSTGDELVHPYEFPAKGQVRDINTASLTAASDRLGFEIIGRQVLKDEERLLEQAVAEAMLVSDLLVVSGGSSQGEKDHTADVMDRLSAPGVFTHGIALKPGKPTILAYDEKSETILTGLPGHPAAALLVFELIIGWLYRRLTNQREPIGILARLTENVAAAGGKTTCLLVSLEKTQQPTAEGGQEPCYKATPVFGKSGLMTTLIRADGYVLIDTDAEGLEKGKDVFVTLF